MQKVTQAIDDASIWLWLALLGASGASALALGMLLRSNEKLSARTVMGTVLHSSAWAVGVFGLSHSRFPQDGAFLVGLSILSGMGVASFVDLVVLMLRQRMGAGPLPPASPSTPVPPAPPGDHGNPPTPGGSAGTRT